MHEEKHTVEQIAHQERSQAGQEMAGRPTDGQGVVADGAEPQPNGNDCGEEWMGPNHGRQRGNSHEAHGDEHLQVLAPPHHDRRQLQILEPPAALVETDGPVDMLEVALHHVTEDLAQNALAFLPGDGPEGDVLIPAVPRVDQDVEDAGGRRHVERWVLPQRVH